MKLTPPQRKALWSCAGLYAASYPVRWAVDYSRQVEFYQQQAIRAAQQRARAKPHSTKAAPGSPAPPAAAAPNGPASAKAPPLRFPEPGKAPRRLQAGACALSGSRSRTKRPMLPGMPSSHAETSACFRRRTTAPWGWRSSTSTTRPRRSSRGQGRTTAPSASISQRPSARITFQVDDNVDRRNTILRVNLHTENPASSLTQNPDWRAALSSSAMQRDLESGFAIQGPGQSGDGGVFVVKGITISGPRKAAPAGSR